MRDYSCALQTWIFVDTLALPKAFLQVVTPRTHGLVSENREYEQIIWHLECFYTFSSLSLRATLYSVFRFRSRNCVGRDGGDEDLERCRECDLVRDFDFEKDRRACARSPLVHGLF